MPGPTRMWSCIPEVLACALASAALMVLKGQPWLPVETPVKSRFTQKSRRVSGIGEGTQSMQAPLVESQSFPKVAQKVGWQAEQSPITPLQYGRLPLQT